MPESRQNDGRFLVIRKINTPSGVQEGMGCNHNVHRMSEGMVLLSYKGVINALGFLKVAFSDVTEKSSQTNGVGITRNLITVFVYEQGLENSQLALLGGGKLEGIAFKPQGFESDAFG